MVRKGHLSLLTGGQAAKTGSRTMAPGSADIEKLVFPRSKRENKSYEGTKHNEQETIVNRTLAVLGIAALGTLLVAAGAGLAQTSKSTKKAPATKADPAAIARGKDLFQQKCSTCHYDTSDAKKIGPGLKGLNKRGTFTVNNNKVTDDNLKTWIENGDSLMPPFKDVIDDSQIKDVIAYVKTL